MKKITRKTILTSVCFINIIPMAANGVPPDNQAEMPMQTTWILLLAGVMLGFYSIYKYEKIKSSPTAIPRKF